MHRALPLILAATAVACGDPGQQREGVAVGNPTKGLTRTVAARLEPAEGLSIEWIVPVDELVLVACDGAELTVFEGGELPTDGQRARPLPSGRVCGVTLRTSDLIVLRGTAERGGNFRITLDVPEIAVSSARPLPARPMLLLLGEEGWLSSAALDLRDGQETVIGPDSPLHRGFVLQLERRSSLVVDDNRNGRVDDEEQVVAR